MILNLNKSEFEIHKVEISINMFSSYQNLRGAHLVTNLMFKNLPYSVQFVLLNFQFSSPTVYSTF